MKRVGYALLVSLALGRCLLQPAIISEAAVSTQISQERLGIRNTVIQKKWALIRLKAEEKVKEQVAEKIKVKEARIAKKQAEVQAEKASAEKLAAEQAKANKQVDQAEAALSNQGDAHRDVTSGASQSGREIGERNREYGEKLSDPNLSQSERQGIITEKKNYNRSRR